MNIEALSTSRGIKGATEFLYNHKENLTIIDESTTIKNHKAIRTRNVLKLSDEFFGPSENMMRSENLDN